MPDEEVPNLVDPNWIRSSDVGSGHRLNWYEDGTVRFAHTCDRKERGVIICAPALQLDGGHRLISEALNDVTVEPSILCSDCGTHGFVRNGQWSDC